MTLGIRYAARSDVGMLREGNEDSAYAGSRLIAVADGMGGHVGGEIASAAAINTLRKLDTDVPAPELLSALEHAVHEANTRLHSIVEGDPSLQGMGTTLTAMLWSGSHIALVHIGDSRAYLLRDGALYQITRDHTLVQSLVEEGRITEDEALSHPHRSLLLRALDGRGEVEPDLTLREAMVGDRYMLCSDGLSGVVSADTIHQVLSGQPDPETAIRQLIDLANRGGGPDNITCVVADVIDLSTTPPSAARPVLAGAAATAQAPAEGPPARGGDSPAQRAAEFRDTLPQPAVGMDGMPQSNGPGGPMLAAPAAAPMAPPPGPPPQQPAGGQGGPGGPGAGSGNHRQPRAKRRWTWLVVAVVIFALLVGGGLFLGYQQLTSGYYLTTGKSAGDKNQVVVFEGDPTTSVLGMNLSSRSTKIQPQPKILFGDLPANAQSLVTNVISAGSSTADVQAAVKRLEDQVCKYVLKPISPTDPTIAIFRGEGQTGCDQAPDKGSTAVKLNELTLADQAKLNKPGGLAAANGDDAHAQLLGLVKDAEGCRRTPGANDCPPVGKPGH